jgi:hypothetical protein
MAEYEAFWKHEDEALLEESQDIIQDFPDASDVIKRVVRIFSDIVSRASCTPAKVGGSEVWSQIVNEAKSERIKLCKTLKGKSLFNALYGVYSITLQELKTALQKSVGKEPCASNLANFHAEDQEGSANKNGGKETARQEKKRRQHMKATNN